jgi:hypothetical protein
MKKGSSKGKAGKVGVSGKSGLTGGKGGYRHTKTATPKPGHYASSMKPNMSKPLKAVKG